MGTPQNVLQYLAFQNSIVPREGDGTVLMGSKKKVSKT